MTTPTNTAPIAALASVFDAARPNLQTSPPIDDESQYYERLPDGARVLIRPIRNEDAELERAFIDGLSEESRRYRFLGQVRASDDVIGKLTNIDYRRDMAYVALDLNANEDREIGVSRFCASDDGRTCECAVVVSDDWQRRGVGHLLMKHLIDVARARGIKRMFSIDAASNTNMRRLAQSLGFQRTVANDFPTEATHSLDL